MVCETLTLTVSLKTPDNEARSALEAIRVKMGFERQVRDLVREEVWELEVEPAAVVAPDGAAAFETGAATSRAAIQRIVETTNLFANPNKHRYELVPGRAGDVRLAEDEVAILVSDRENATGESMAVAVRRLGVDSVRGARRWVRWRLRLSKPPAPGDADLVPFIRKVAVADSRDGGILCNPHIEEALAVLPWGDEKRLAR